MGLDRTESGLIYIDPAAEAVADAILVTQSRLLFSYLNEVGGVEGQDPEESLEKSSDGLCGKASIDSIYFLTKKYPQLFQKMAVLATLSVNSYVNPNGVELRRTNWEHHAYFLAQDVSGTWYAGSPANYTKEEAGYMKPFTSTDLQGVVEQIQERDGGVWPSIEFIERSFDSNYSSPAIKTTESGKDVLECLVIEKHYRRDKSSRSSYPIEVSL